MSLVALTPGTRIGVYEVVAPLGAGGMGEVYRAKDTRLGRAVALKTLPPEFALDPDRRARFEREAKTLATLNHPHIAQIYGLEEVPGADGAPPTLALAMELVEGEDLAQRIAHGPVPLDEAIPLARQIAEGLEAAHEAGIVHRDLKPANIRVTPEGVVKVLDFGLAKPTETGAASVMATHSPTLTSPALTTRGVVLGTAAYMAPEQAKGKPVDRRADIWAFGCVLYELLTGRRAFEGEDVPEILGAIIKTEPDWTKLRATTPRHLRTLLTRCLAKDKTQRLQHIGDARLELAGGFTEQAPAESSRANRPASRLAWIVAGLAVTVAAVLALTMARPLPGSAVVAETLHADIDPPPGVRAAFDRGFALSPDGRWLAFTARDQPGEILLWLREMRTGASQPISGTADAAFPFWSPDSQQIAFWSERRIKRVHVIERIAQVVADAPAAAIFFRGGTWLEDDSIVLTDSANLLSRVSSSGGTAQRIEGVPGADEIIRTFFPRGLAGTQALLVGIEYRDSARTGIYRMDVSRPDAASRLVETTVNGWATVALGPRRLAWMNGPVFAARTFDGSSLGTDASVPVATGVGSTVGWTHATASVDGERLILGFQRGGSAPAMWVRRDGTRLGTTDVTSQSAIRLAPDGQRAAVTRGNDVWVIDSGRQVATRVTTTTESESQPLWSPDGRRLAYRRIGVPDLFVVDLETSRTEHHANVLPANSFTGVDWSPDGRALVFAAPFGDRASNLELVLYDLVSRQSTRLTTTPFNEMHPRFSPDGRAVAYTSDETGTREVYVRSIETLASRRVSTDGGEFPMWRRDGRELVYVSPTGAFMSVPMRQGTDPAGSPVLLFTADPMRSLTDQARFDMAPDGERFLIVPEPAPTPLVLIEHWRPVATAPSASSTPVR